MPTELYRIIDKKPEVVGTFCDGTSYGVTELPDGLWVYVEANGGFGHKVSRVYENRELAESHMGVNFSITKKGKVFALGHRVNARRV